MYQGLNQELVEDNCNNVICLSKSSHIPGIGVSTLQILWNFLRAWPVLIVMGAEKSLLSKCIEPYKD